jgi:Ca2+-binding RTX toxin-like protein
MFGAGNSVFESYGNGTDSVYTESDFTLPANVENLLHVTFYSYNNPTAGVRLTGNGLDNIMGGHRGADVIRGLGGNDTIYGGWNPGGSGVDVLIGGTGQDKFVMLLDRSYFGSDGIVLRAGDGASAFQRPGPQVGDVIDFSTPGNDRFWDLSWGGTTEKGEGFLWLENSVGRSFDTLVFANNDADEPNFVLRIEDGPFVVASDYTIDDFLF